MTFDQLEEERMELEDLIGGSNLVRIYKQLRACYDSNPGNVDNMNQVADVMLRESGAVRSEISQVAQRIVKFLLNEANTMNE